MEVGYVVVIIASEPLSLLRPTADPHSCSHANLKRAQHPSFLIRTSVYFLKLVQYSVTRSGEEKIPPTSAQNSCVTVLTCRSTFLLPSFPAPFHVHNIHLLPSFLSVLALTSLPLYTSSEPIFTPIFTSLLLYPNPHLSTHHHPKPARRDSLLPQNKLC